MTIFSLITGVILLFMGRKFFWLFVGLVGFATGYYAVQQVFVVHNSIIILLLAVGLGLLCALLAVFLQRIAILVSGFMAGWYFIRAILIFIGFNALPGLWLVTLIGGIIAAVLLSITFDYALIILSAVVGALAIIHSNLFPQNLNFIIFIILFFVGFIFQIKTFQSKKT